MQTSPAARRPLSLLAASRLATWGLLAACLAAPALATPETLDLDPAACTLGFQLGATGHDVTGTLALDRGQIVFDRTTGAAQGEIVLDALRTATGSGGRDRTMHADVLRSAQHPKILFRIERLEGSLAASGRSDVTLHGTVSVGGIEHALALPCQVEIEGSHVRASSTFEIPYVAWGLEDPSIFFLKVAKAVSIRLKVEGELQAAGR